MYRIFYSTSYVVAILQCTLHPNLTKVNSRSVTTSTTYTLTQESTNQSWQPAHQQYSLQPYFP